MTNRTRTEGIAGLLGVSIAVAGCGGSASGTNAPHSANAGPPLQVVVLSAPSDQCAPCILVGKDRRVALAIVDRNGVPVPNATVRAQVAAVPVGAGKPEALGPPVAAPYKGELLQDKGVYVLHQSFDRAGIYRVTADARKGAESSVTEANFQVITTDPNVAVGAPAPLSRGPLASQVADISTIDTGLTPDDMHYITVADAIAAHHPLVVYFGSPGFCQSKTCAPEVEVVKALEAKYRARGVDFVHVETYKGGRPDAARTVNPEFDMWKLTTDPWVFLVDRDGRVSAKFDGPATTDEIEPFLAPMAG